MKDTIIQVLDEKEPFKLSNATIETMIDNCKRQMESALGEVLVQEFQIGDKLEFQYVIEFTTEILEPPAVDPKSLN